MASEAPRSLLIIFTKKNKNRAANLDGLFHNGATRKQSRKTLLLLQPLLQLPLLLLLHLLLTPLPPVRLHTFFFQESINEVE